jgi:hypothetical protein
MKILKYWNATQIAHYNDKERTCARYCAVFGCDGCLCDKRPDTKCCCDIHKSKLNNELNKTKNHQINLNRKINIRNAKIIVDLFNRGIRQLDIEVLKITGFDFSVAPVPGELYGKKVGMYRDIALWVDVEKNIHLEKN